ncbi:uncharacterized protein [Venturia canescens]|uniref:uncharacterized protein n=1 Tax=Venturia canescens TaxID=32260 RepID=UPI001C9C609F|nr:uncharacterized protein LOC122412939 [Venturia canescens]
MTKFTKYKPEMLGWHKEPGPLKVWRVVDGRKKTEDGKIARFSIQEIPVDRFDDALDLMCTIFLRDEPICSSSNIVNDAASMDDFCKLWSFSLQQGVAVGAFLVDGNNPKPVLAGVNMTLVDCDATEEALQTGIEFRSEVTQKILKLLHDLETEKNPREVYNVDKFMTAFGLCVDSRFRGQGLGVELLNARNEICAAYDIPATTTVFTAPAAQKAAAQAGFELLLERHFVDVKNEDGTEMFPGITSKVVKLMGKKF